MELDDSVDPSLVLFVLKCDINQKVINVRVFVGDPKIPKLEGKVDDVRVRVRPIHLKVTGLSVHWIVDKMKITMYCCLSFHVERN